MKKLTLILVAIATFALSATTLKAQSIQDFHGTWIGFDQAGNSIELSLNPNWSCLFKINGAVVFANNAIVMYRLPGYDPSVAAELQNTGPKVIKFYTQNALQGILAPGPQTQGNQEPAGIPQIYTGLALITGADMALYIDVNNFSSVPPNVNLNVSDDQDEALPAPYCNLVKL